MLIKRKKMYNTIRIDSRFSDAITKFYPGILLCVALALVAQLTAHIESIVFGREWLEAIVIAIVLGVLMRSSWTPPSIFAKGIGFSGKILLEIAIVLLGASLSAVVVLAAGWLLILGIAGTVAVAIFASYFIGRMLGLSPRLATLVACGNSICGNSAIAAAAPIIGANGNDVAASISFTAVLGVIIVFTLPLLGPAFGFSGLQYGVFAGMTVYAVPQVLAATAPIGAVSVQIGTLVKLVRVLMLGPVLVGLGLIYGSSGGGRITFKQLVPWFIVGFLGMAILRSLGAFPDAIAHQMSWLAGQLTIIAMAALGLGVDIRTVAKAGGAVTATVLLSLTLLGTISFWMIRFIVLF